MVAYFRIVISQPSHPFITITPSNSLSPSLRLSLPPPPTHIRTHTRTHTPTQLVMFPNVVLDSTARARLCPKLNYVY